MKKNVTIIGLGLIGGSLGLALKRNTSIHVKGFDSSPETMKEAYRRGIIDEISITLQDACDHADIIIFSTPVNTTVKLMYEVATLQLKKDVILTDTGSTKGPIMQAAAYLIETGITFIGGNVSNRVVSKSTAVG